MLYHTKTVRQVFTELDTSKNGLSTHEAEKRLATYGHNTIKVAKKPLWRRLIEPFMNVFMLVLFIAVGISLLYNEVADAMIIGVIIAISALIYYIGQFYAMHLQWLMQKHSIVTVKVFRDNKVVALDSHLLVPGDILMVSEGEKIPVDARVISTRSLRVDESQLTGETDPVDKQSDKISSSKAVYERTNMLFQGSSIVIGEAIVVVTATGNATEFGQLTSLNEGTESFSPIQERIEKLLSQIIGIVTILAAITFGLSLMRGTDFTESLHIITALLVSAMPESLPVVVSIILILGIRRMAARKVLIRNMTAIDTIGAINTIITGTSGLFTRNELSVQEIWQPEGNHAALFALLSKVVNQETYGAYDPLDTALTEYAARQHIKPQTQPALVSFPFSQSVAMSGTLWHYGSNFELILKGTPEHILARCDLTEGEREQAEAILHKLSTSGYRVIGLAHHYLKYSITDLSELKSADKLTFDGFVAVADVLHPEAKRSIAAAIKAGVSVRMITGDHFETAYHVGSELGIVTSRSQVLDGRHMSIMSDKELEKVIDSIHIFSRVTPEQRYRILALLKKYGVTAMTGDKANDTPALVNAHVGITLKSSTGSTKDVSDIILLDDNFKNIIGAIHESRTIFANIRRTLFYLLSTNAGEVLTIIGALAVGMINPLLPVQILWINIVTDTLLVIPLGLEPGEKSNMLTRPRNSNAPILSRFIINRMILIALSMAIVTLTAYAIYSSEYGHNYGSTIAFNTLVVMQWAAALCARGDNESLFSRIRIASGAFYVGLIIAITLQLLALFGPLGGLLHITTVAIGDLFTSSVIAFIVPVILTEIHKYIGRRYYQTI